MGDVGLCAFSRRITYGLVVLFYSLGPVCYWPRETFLRVPHEEGVVYGQREGREEALEESGWLDYMAAYKAITSFYSPLGCESLD